MTVQILVGDALAHLRNIPDQSVNCCITSPPYFGLRDYGVDGQIGLEPTPDEFVTSLVAVFREVRRVLRDDGTLWLNLGDSYAAQRGGTRMPAETLAGGIGGVGDEKTYRGRGGPADHEAGIAQRGLAHRNASAIGLKHKDLIGIPWRVAFALQQPYYTGRITKEIDRMWLAAMIDGEGYMFIHKRKAGTDSGAKFTKEDGTEVSYARKQDTYSPGLEVANTHLGIVERCQQITGLGTITRQDKDRRLPLYRWHLRADEARQIVREVYPYLIGKRQQARILCGCPTNGDQADDAHRALMLLHNGGLTDVDFKEPESMHETGWYLRQDCIWSKPNPMPESVKDRCTKAHEYIFLLSKSPKYYFDSDAIKEPAIHAGCTVKSRGKYDDGTGRPIKGAETHVVGERVVGATRNRRSVWNVTTKPFKGAHFATFPPDLIEPCVLAGCPEGGVVLDPFGGAGTTAGVALKHGRSAVLCELNPEYAAMVPKRIEAISGIKVPPAMADDIAALIG